MESPSAPTAGGLLLFKPTPNIASYLPGMKPMLILICAVVFASAMGAQTYRVDVPNPFRTPDYLAMANLLAQPA